MLTVAYCRVSTEEQAEEGSSIAGQADKLRVYAELHDLGDVVVITDPGLSGKNLERPGLQRLLEMVGNGHVGHILVWRLDRLSRNLGDLSALADVFLAKGVTLHSFTEKLDLSTATGRMFYNVLGSFAQFYREQLAENVRMGMHQAIQQGRWINRAKTGYDMRDGVLVLNDQAPVVREIFRLRAEGLSHQRIEERTGVKYSTVRLILQSRIYLGEVLYNGEWFPGSHQPLISLEEFEAAHRGSVPGRRRLSREILSGRVRCGLCHRLAAVEYRQNGEPVFRCKHRGQGCAMPRRAAWALERAVLLGMRLLGDDAALREAIRCEIGTGGAQGPKGRATGRADARRDARVAELETKRRKLLELHYADKIGSDLYAEEELRLRQQIDLAKSEQIREQEALRQADDVVQRFEEVAALLAQLNVEAVWKEATQDERRVLVHELLEEVALFPDHLEVVVSGAPRLNVTLEEVGVQNRGVRGGT
ncbi:MAG: recombinase family protein [Frankiales bacterium]|nr:recombinase family protein [Frankiales bacterium]